MPETRRITKHVHIGFFAIGTAFVGVLLAGTLWKLAATHLATSTSPSAQQLGKAMIFQYG